MGCAAPTVSIGGVIISTSDYTNASTLMNNLGSDSDPIYDGYEENIASGNNNKNETGGGQFPPPTQTTPPSTISETPNQSDTSAGTPPAGIPVTCSTWDGSDYDLQLSPNFKLRNLSINAIFPNQVTSYDSTYTAQVRCCNLQAVALNICEPMKAKFGNIQINSGIRNANSTSSGLSQHVKGEAVDIQIPGWTYEQYWANTQWIKNNIPYDQFIFEHSSSGTAWFHLSFSQTSNRGQVLTMYRNQYSPGLLRFY